MNDINRRRKKAFSIVLATVVGSAIVAAAPKVHLDTAKQIFLTIADIAMCMMIWDIYFEEKLYQKNIPSILLELFFVITVSGITSYITSKVILTFSNKLTQWLGVIGWSLTGAIAALAVGLLGIAWVFYCDDLYKN
jgi:hypothetical protein